jgi:hypothetical protein
VETRGLLKLRAIADAEPTVPPPAATGPRR